MERPECLAGLHGIHHYVRREGLRSEEKLGHGLTARRVQFLGEQIQEDLVLLALGHGIEFLVRVEIRLPYEHSHALGFVLPVTVIDVQGHEHGRGEHHDV